MKKNLLIMMMMVLCAGFVSAQTINTVRGFVPGGSTGDNATYVVIGQPFSMMSVANADAQAEVMVGLAQMQLITDTTMTVVGYKDGYHEHGLDLNAQELLEALDDLSTCSNGEVEGYMGFLNFQKPNLAHNNDNFEYYYDSLFVVKVFICPDSTTDAAGNKYEVIALNEKCWINSNLRTTVACGGGSVEGMIYNSELNEVTEDLLPTYGMLYTFAAATGATTNADGILVGAQCDEETGYLQGICPCNWHLPTAEEMAPLFVLPAENLRVNGNWIVEGNNNLTGFSAEPAGFYNSTSQRFEGLLTETDYWMINCEKLDEPIQDVFQLIYSCNTPLKPQHSSEDALSVRCVYDIVREFDNCENPTPQPTPPPTPSECSLSVTVQPSTTSAKSITGTVTGTLENIAGATVSVTSYTVLNAVEPVEVVPAQTYPLTVNQQDGTFSWTYAPEGMGDQLQAITGYVTVIGNTATCGDEKEFNTATTPTQNTCASLTNITSYGSDLFFKADVVDADENTSFKISYRAVYNGVEAANSGVVENVPFPDNTLNWSYVDYEGNYASIRNKLISVNCTIYVYNANGECTSYQETVYQAPDCPVLSQITIGDNYSYSATISNYDLNAGAFYAEYRVYQVGATAPIDPAVYEQNLTLTQGDQSGVMNVSGHMSDAILGQYDQISKIEVFLVYAPSDLFGQCNGDEVYATIYEATPAQEVTCPTITNLTATLTTVGCEFVINDYDADYIVTVEYSYSNQSWTDNNPTVVPGDNNTATVTSTYGGNPYGDNALYATVRVNTGNANCGTDHIVTSDQVEIVPSNEQTGFLCPEGSVDFYTSTSFTVTYTDYQQVLDNNASGNPYFIIHYTNDYESDPIYETNPSNGVEFVFGNINLNEVEYFKYFIPASVKSEYQYACPDIANSGYISGIWTPSN